MVTPALEVRGLTVRYGSLQVCTGVDLQLPADTVGVLAGTNGAGKSTVLRALAGLVKAEGSVKLFGEDISRLSAEQRARRGLVLAPGGYGNFPSLTVAESLAVGCWTGRAGPAAAAVEEALTLFPTLAARRGQRCDSLSAGEQQLVVLGRAVVARPRVLLVDEVALGLAGTLAESVVRAIAGRPPVLLVDQSLDRALALASWAWFLERGQIRFSGPPADLAAR